MKQLMVRASGRPNASLAVLSMRTSRMPFNRFRSRTSGGDFGGLVFFTMLEILSRAGGRLSV